MKVLCNQRPSNKSRANRLMRRLGDRLDAVYTNRDQLAAGDYDLLIQWGFKPTISLRQAVSNRKPYIILDMGHWEGQRTERQSISINGLHGLSMRVPNIVDMPPRYHPPIKAWTETGSNILIAGQLGGDAALRGENPETWMRKQAALAVERYGMPAKLRPHPKMINPWEPPLEPLQDALDDAFIVVTHSSTVGVTALLEGVRTVATSPGSAVYGHIAEGSTWPGRAALFHELAYRDYDLSNDEDADAAAEYIIKAYPTAVGQASVGQVEIPGSRL